MTPHERFDHRQQKCNAVGYLLVHGEKVGMIRCGELAGHNLPTTRSTFPPGRITAYEEPAEGTPHRAELTWTDDQALAETWPEALDPDEAFDVDVPLEPAPESVFEPVTIEPQHIYDLLSAPPKPALRRDRRP